MNLSTVEEFIKVYKAEKDIYVSKQMQGMYNTHYLKQDPAVVAKCAMQCRNWASKWTKRFEVMGLKDLHDSFRTGRPPRVHKKTLGRIIGRMVEARSSRRPSCATGYARRRAVVQHDTRKQAYAWQPARAKVHGKHARQARGQGGI